MFLSTKYLAYSSHHGFSFLNFLSEILEFLYARLKYFSLNAKTSAYLTLLALAIYLGTLSSKPFSTKSSKEMYLISKVSEHTVIYGEFAGPTGFKGKICQ